MIPLLFVFFSTQIDLYHLNVLLLIKSRLDPSQETDEIATMRRGFWHGVQRPLDVVDEEARVLDLVPSFLIA